MREITAKTKSGKTTTVKTNLNLDQAVKILEEIAPWNSFAARLLKDYQTYGDKLWPQSADWIVVVAQQQLDRKKNQKAVNLTATAKFFQSASPNVGEMVFTELPIKDYALQLFSDTRKPDKRNLIRVRRRMAGQDEREYIGTIQPDGRFVVNKNVSEEELKALKAFNRKPELKGTVKLGS